MLIEDENLVRDTTEMMIREMGYSVSSFASGTAVLELINSSEFDDVFDAAIIDLSLSRAYEGRDIFRYLKRKFPDLTGVLCTGHSEEHIFSNYYEYGFSAVLKKPYDFYELKRVLEYVIPLPQGVRIGKSR